MKAKFGLAALDAIQKNYKIFLDRLIKGYEKITGKQPEGIELTMIKREAYQKAEESAKVVDMEGKTLDASKPIMGGKQMIEESDVVISKGERPFGDNIRDAYSKAGRSKRDANKMIEALDSPGAKKSYEIMEETLGVRLYGDETFEELMKIKETGMHPRGEPPLKKADGGRINFALGGDALTPGYAGAGLQNIIGAGLVGPNLFDPGPNLFDPGLGSLGGVDPGLLDDEDEFADIQGQTAGFGVVSALKKLGPIGDYLIKQGRMKTYNKAIDAGKRANEIAYQKRLELEEKIRQATALRAAQKEIERMGYTDYGSGAGIDSSLNLGPGGSYTGRGDTGTPGLDSIDYDLKDGGLITMFKERR